MKKAVSVLIERQGLFLSVSRRNDVTQWGLPGGKVDPGETVAEAAVRETGEEVGLALNARDLKPVYTGICPGKGVDDTYEVQAYVVKVGDELLASLAPERGLYVAWLPAAALTNPVLCPFARYNVNAFEALQTASVQKETV